MMKTKILFFLFLMGIVLIGTNAFAAGVASPVPGQTAVYSVTSGLTSYEWKIYEGTSGAGGTTEATGGGTDYTGTIGTSNSISIVWSAASAGSSFYIWVQGTDSNGCLTDPKTFDVTVGAPTVCIATDATEVGGVTPAAPTNTSQCSLLTDNSTGASGSGYGDTSTFYVTLEGGVPSLSSGSAYTVTYTIASAGGATVTETTAANLATDSNGDGALAITITATDYINHFTKTTSGDLTVTVTVTKVTYGGEDISGSCNYTIAVKQLPTIAF